MRWNAGKDAFDAKDNSWISLRFKAEDVPGVKIAFEYRGKRKLQSHGKVERQARRICREEDVPTVEVTYDLQEILTQPESTIDSIMEPEPLPRNPTTSKNLASEDIVEENNENDKIEQRETVANATVTKSFFKTCACGKNEGQYQICRSKRVPKRVERERKCGQDCILINRRRLNQRRSRSLKDNRQRQRSERSERRRR